MTKPLIVFGLETSCDETAAAIVSYQNKKFELLAHALATQYEIHSQFGGVYPELAARAHSKNMLPVINKVLTQAKIDKSRIDVIAVTAGPGLVGSLIAGVTAATTLSHLWQKPLVGVNHLEGHIYTNLINNPQISWPAIGLVVSGGHTLLLEIAQMGHYRLIGETLDDACGEAFDKVAKLLGLGFPGGPALSKLAQSGDAQKYALPLPLNQRNNLNFSYSGLKTAVVHLVHKLGGSANLNDQQKADIAASFEAVAIQSLVQKTIRAAKQIDARTIIVGGGVSANHLLRSELAEAATQNGLHLLKSEIGLCTDNAVGITMAGAVKYSLSPNDEKSTLKVNPVATIASK